MKIKTVLDKTDFIPMIKIPRFWMAPSTLHKGSILEVEPEIGHQLLATYPKAFQVVSYDDPVKQKRIKKVDEESLTHGESAAEFSVAEG